MIRRCAVQDAKYNAHIHTGTVEYLCKMLGQGILTTKQDKDMHYVTRSGVQYFKFSVFYILQFLGHVPGYIRQRIDNLKRAGQLWRVFNIGVHTPTATIRVTLQYGICYETTM